MDLKLFGQEVESAHAIASSRSNLKRTVQADMLLVWRCAMADRICTVAADIVGGRARPYFLFERDMDEETFRQILADPNNPARIALLRELLREARPADVWMFVTPQLVASEWDSVAPGLGRTRPFWLWLLERWRARGFFST